MTDDATDEDPGAGRNWAELFGGPAGWAGALLPLNPLGEPPPYYVLKQRIALFGGQRVEVAWRYKLSGKSDDDDEAWRYDFLDQVDPTAPPFTWFLDPPR